MARTDQIARELGFPRPQENALNWLGELTGRLYIVLTQAINSINLLILGYVLPLSSLPTASAQNRGRMVIVNGGGSTPDKAYICRYDGTSFSWFQVM